MDQGAVNFWLGTVVVGIIVGVLGNGATRLFGLVFRHGTKSWKAWSTESLANDYLRLKHFKTDTTKLIGFYAFRMSLMIMGVLVSVLSPITALMLEAGGMSDYWFTASLALPMVLGVTMFIQNFWSLGTTVINLQGWERFEEKVRRVLGEETTSSQVADHTKGSIFD